MPQGHPTRSWTHRPTTMKATRCVFSGIGTGRTRATWREPPATSFLLPPCKCSFTLTTSTSRVTARQLSPRAPTRSAAVSRRACPSNRRDACLSRVVLQPVLSLPTVPKTRRPLERDGRKHDGLLRIDDYGPYGFVPVEWKTTEGSYLHPTQPTWVDAHGSECPRRTGAPH
jgi:hypothetical protein